jgi:uncharacterized protein (TIGR02001 family)
VVRNVAVRALPLVAFVVPVLQTSIVHAQVSGSVALVSEYSFRGVSLGDGRPALQLDVAYDSRNDWYVGGFASRVKLPDERSGVQVLAYAGRAVRISNGTSLEFGAIRSTYFGAADYNYTEVHAGVATENLAGRLYVSPDYYGMGMRTLYTELDGNLPLLPWLQLLGHAGYLHALNATSANRADRWDARAGIGMRFDEWNVRVLALAAQREQQASAATDYYYGRSSEAASQRLPVPRTVMVSVSRSF